MVEKQKIKKFKVFYFMEGEHAWDDEKRKSTIIFARSEVEAEENKKKYDAFFTKVQFADVAAS